MSVPPVSPVIPAWISGGSYSGGINQYGSLVTYSGASYQCILSTSGTTAPNTDTTHWFPLAWQSGVTYTPPTSAVNNPPTGSVGYQTIATYAYDAIYGTVPVYATCVVAHTSTTFENDLNAGYWYIKRYEVEGNWFSGINAVAVGEMMHLYGRPFFGNTGAGGTNATTLINFQLDNGADPSYGYVAKRQGIIFENTQDCWISTGLGILGNQSGSPVLGLYNCNNINVSNVKLYNGNATQGHAVVLSTGLDYAGVATPGCSNCLFSNSYLQGAGGAGGYGIVISSGSNYNSIVGCSTRGSGSSGISDSGSSNIIANNQI